MTTAASYKVTAHRRSGLEWLGILIAGLTLLGTAIGLALTARALNLTWTQIIQQERVWQETLDALIEQRMLNHVTLFGLLSDRLEMARLMDDEQESARPQARAGQTSLLERIVRVPLHDLGGLNASCVNLSGVDISGAPSGANLPRAIFTGANLRGADLTRANLTNADLRGADLRGANLRNAILRDAELRLAVFTGDQEFSGVDFTNAVLSGAVFMGVDFGDANLDRATLTDVDLTDADLSGVKNLTQQQLDGACANRAPRVPTDRRWRRELTCGTRTIEPTCDWPEYVPQSALP